MRRAEELARQVGASPAERDMLIALSNRGAVKRWTRVTTHELAEATGHARRTVQRGTTRLAACGALLRKVVRGSRGAVSEYRLALPESATTRRNSTTTTLKLRDNQPRESTKPQPIVGAVKGRPQGDIKAVKGRSPHDTFFPPVKRVKPRARAGGFTTTWNAHCGALPQLRTTPTQSPAVALIESALDDAGDDLALLGRAIGRAARDPHYRENRFGFETFCRHIDRWLDDRDLTPAPVVRRPRVIEATAPVDLEAQARYAREVGDQLRRKRTTTEATA